MKRLVILTALALAITASPVAAAGSVSSTCGDQILSPCEPTEILGLLVTGFTGTVKVSWGDGTHETATVSQQITAIHAYPIAGDYTVTVKKGRDVTTTTVFVR
jgi:PKD repeat protein